MSINTYQIQNVFSIHLLIYNILRNTSKNIFLFFLKTIIYLFSLPTEVIFLFHLFSFFVIQFIGFFFYSSYYRSPVLLCEISFLFHYIANYNPLLKKSKLYFLFVSILRFSLSFSISTLLFKVYIRISS